MTAYLLHDDQYAKDIFDFSIDRFDVFSSAQATTLIEALGVTDPREFSSTFLIIGSTSQTGQPATRYAKFIYTAKQNTTVDYVAFNKHNFSLYEYDEQVLNKIEIRKSIGGSNFLIETINPLINSNDNIVEKFTAAPLEINDTIEIWFYFNSLDVTSLTKKYGSADLLLSYIQIGKSTELRELRAPLNITYGTTYEAKHQRSDTGLVIGTSSKVQPNKIDLQIKNQTKAFIDANFQNMATDMSKNPFFIFDDSGNLPLIPFCWLTSKIQSPKINANHLYDITIKAQAKVYE